MSKATKTHIRTENGKSTICGYWLPEDTPLDSISVEEWHATRAKFKAHQLDHICGRCRRWIHP